MTRSFFHFGLPGELTGSGCGRRPYNPERTRSGRFTPGDAGMSATAGSPALVLAGLPATQIRLPPYAAAELAAD